MSDRAVVLISGWTGAEFMWSKMESSFAHTGYDVIRTDISHGFNKIQAYAQGVAEVVNAIKDTYAHTTVIGHSMGGLVGRYGLVNHLFAADAYVSIGTPHQGSMLAHLAPWSASASQMCPDSPFIQRLNAKAWDGTPALALQAGIEEFVWPKSSARIAFGENVAIPNATHTTIVRHQRTFLEIWAWLTDMFFSQEFFIDPEDEGITTVVA